MTIIKLCKRNKTSAIRDKGACRAMLFVAIHHTPSYTASYGYVTTASCACLLNCFETLVMITHCIYMYMG